MSWNPFYAWGQWTCLFYYKHKHYMLFTAWLCTTISRLWLGNPVAWTKAHHYHRHGEVRTAPVLNEECDICNVAVME